MVLNRLNGVLKEGLNASGSFGEKVREHFPRLSSSIDAILIRRTINSGYEAYSGDINKYVNASTRIEKMNNKDRSGDIVLIMKSETDSTVIDRYTTGVSCKSWHGSLNPSDSYVPLIVAYPGGNKKEIDDILKKDTACKDDYSGCKGNWKLSDIVKEIISGQYK
ncbi:MAG: hypothetical protein A2Z50_07620 [Nitrospirae bacterium RBG_19FT_COMBO_42_15]|nr:MAG: hypothetical protein A2Z50_07620 [Nitrospirae bacterium RBG_19FT_COMBO_42_15]